MNTTQLKSYAPAARRSFIEAVSAQAARVGITAAGIATAEIQGDVLLMELHGYLDHGYRVLSHPEAQGRPEILDHAADIDLPGLDREKAIELKLDGTADEELYRLLLLAQCNALHQAMPFLFERIGDETELLLPANLLHSDSLIRQLVEQIPEGLWQEIEIIGWLYQFYISEKKDQVIGKVVKSEDIPAATQLFTPNWIVKYMVQNSLGAQWLATYPQSPLKAQMDYYIEPAEQTDEVNAQLAAITPSQLNPETLTLIDPASGSGHILVEAYALFKAIYLERGYRQRDVPQLILEKNLFGLDIDERAAQLTGFALMMKGRADDRRLFERGVKLNVMALVDSAGFDAEALAKGVELSDYRLKPQDLTEVKRLFEHATTFGSLIQVPEGLASSLPALKRLSEATSQDLFVSEALKRLEPLVQQAELLAAQYDAVVANPPYMGEKHTNASTKKFAKDNFPEAKSDLFACFIERSYTLAKEDGYNAMVTMQSWMFLSSFEAMRKHLLREKTIRTMAQIGFNSFPSLNSKIALATVFSIQNLRTHGLQGTFIDLNSAPQSADKQEVFLAQSRSEHFAVAADDFAKVPGSPVAYWASEQVRKVFAESIPLSEQASFSCGMTTGDNSKFVRLWHEIDDTRVGYGIKSSEAAAESGRKWFPYNKGGEFRKWFGNNTYLVNWEHGGREILDSGSAYPRAQHSYFRESATWSFIGIKFGVRYSDPGALFDMGGCSAFPLEANFAMTLCAFLCSKIASQQLGVMNPTLNFQVGNVGSLPWFGANANAITEHVAKLGRELVDAGRDDWDAYERSWDFQSLPLLTACIDPTPTLESSYTAWTRKNRDTIAEMKRLEEQNNRLFIDAYGLADELTPDVPIEQITLTVNPAYRYGGKLTEKELWTRFRQDTMEELVSYAIGCMMGRYSLDAPGLIYAHSSNEGFDPSRYPTFPADDDGIIPITDTDWFPDDAAHRLIDFLSVAWDESHLEPNLTLLAENLSPRKGESSRETIRRYLHMAFFKKHLRTYKKRPIYWLFSSGRLRAFQCLVYVHRYNEGTLSRVRSEYVIPLQGKMAARLEKLQGDIQMATSTAHRRRIEKEHAKLEKQQVELLAFDEKLRHYADRRISLDLDDGVKVNYGKFGDLLAEVKSIHGKLPETS